MNDLHGVRCDLYLHQQAVDTTSPAGKAVFQMLGVFAEFERSLIRARVLAGLKRAKAAGKVLGRPKVKHDIELAIRARLQKGKLGMRKIARELGVGTSDAAGQARDDCDRMLGFFRCPVLSVLRPCLSGGPLSLRDPNSDVLSFAARIAALNIFCSLSDVTLLIPETVDWL